MNSFYGCLIIILFSLSPDFLPQVKSYNIINRYNGVDIHLNFSRESYIVKNEEGKKIIEFLGAINEGKPGAPVLPSKTIFLAIPPDSKINPVLTNKKESIISNADIKFNPEIKLNEERIEYKNGVPAPKYFVNDIYPQKEIEVVGYTWFRDYYCAVVQIN